jgi:DNA-binding GntR family transcriptional regulator
MTEPAPGAAVLRQLLRDGRPELSLVDRIADDVAVRIIDGRLPPGADVNSVELARRYASSRTPVREALLTLEREGLVELAARRRPRVARFTLAQVRELYQVRVNLYGLVSELVVRDGTEAGLAALRDRQARLAEAAEAGDVERYFWHNVAFRQAEADVAGNRRLARMLNSLGLRTLQLRHLSLSLPGRLARSVADHERLLAAYSDRDTELAVATNRAIARTALRAIESSHWPGLADADVSAAHTLPDDSMAR